LKQSPQIAIYCLYLQSKGIAYELEYKFHPTRKWRADIAIPSLRALIEFDGIMSAKSRHTSVTGFTNDCEKINQAQLVGWIVLRYTVINKAQFYQDIDYLHERVYTSTETRSTGKEI
jgi:hypothetical protein